MCLTCSQPRAPSRNKFITRSERQKTWTINLMHVLCWSIHRLFRSSDAAARHHLPVCQHDFYLLLSPCLDDGNKKWEVLEWNGGKFINVKSFLIRVEFCYLEKNIYYWEILQTNICHGGKRSQVNVVFRLRLLKHVFHQYFISFSCKHQFIDFIRRSMLFPRFKERKRSAINQHKYACLWPAKRLCKKRV